MSTTLQQYYQVITARIERAKNMQEDDGDFLHREAIETIIQRLSATNRQFSHPVLLFKNSHSHKIASMLGRSCPQIEQPFLILDWPEPKDGAEILNLEPESADLIISVFDLGYCSDLVAVLLQANFALKPDGLFLACFAGEGSLEELKQALLQTETSLSNGAASRVASFPGARQLGDLLQQSGFKLVVADLEERKIGYANLQRLLGDIRANGAASLIGSKLPGLPKATLKSLTLALQDQDSEKNGRFSVSFNMIFVSGWKYDESQQQPLRPGSAKHSLKDFL